MVGLDYLDFVDYETAAQLYEKVGFSDETDRAYMTYMPDVTDRIRWLETELKATLPEENDHQ